MSTCMRFYSVVSVFGDVPIALTMRARGDLRAVEEHVPPMLHQYLRASLGLLAYV